MSLFEIKPLEYKTKIKNKQNMKNDPFSIYMSSGNYKKTELSLMSKIFS